MTTDVINQIDESLQRGNLALFLGADLPQAVTGLSARADLARDLARRHALRASDSLSIVAQQVGRQGRRFQFTNFLRDQLDTTGHSPKAFHHRLVELVQRYDVTHLVTTAYDDLLQRAFDARNAPLDVVIRSSDMVFVNRRTPTLLKLYGDLAQPDTLIVTEDDHYSLGHNRDKETLLDEVRSLLARSAVLFLGYDLADPDFQLLWRKVLDRAGRFAIGAYAAWPGAGMAQKQIWADRQVRILDLPAQDLLDRLLDEPQLATRHAGPSERSQSQGPDIDPDDPPIAAIRELLEAAFTPASLKQFCRDRPDFRPLVNHFGPADGLSDMVDKVIVYCGQYLLWDELLAEVAAVNARQYARFLERIGSTAPTPPVPTRPPAVHEPKPQVATSGGDGAPAITWLHLSDLHFCLPASHTGDLLPYDANVVLRAFLEDVGQCIRDDGLQPDLIAVTGDIAFSGQAREYDLARTFFDDLLRITGLPKDRLFLVPGNHDVDRNQISRGARGIAAALTDRASTNEVLANPADRALLFARFEGYRAFVNDYLGGAFLFDDERYFYAHTIDAGGLPIGLLGLNSAWLAHGGDEDRGQLLIGERQVRAALDQAAGAALKIALLHHPFAWLREFEQNDSQALLTDRCDFVLHGHMHRVDLLQARGPDTNAFIIAAGACYETREQPNAYNFVRLEPGSGEGVVHLRTYSDRRGGFWTKDVVNYRNVPDGVYHFALPAG